MVVVSPTSFSYYDPLHLETNHGTRRWMYLYAQGPARILPVQPTKREGSALACIAKPRPSTHHEWRFGIWNSPLLASNSHNRKFICRSLADLWLQRDDLIRQSSRLTLHPCLNINLIILLILLIFLLFLIVWQIAQLARQRGCRIPEAECSVL